MKEQVITIKWPSGRYQLYLPNALNNISMTDLRKKVFEWLFKNLWVSPENERTVEALDAYIPEWIQDLKGEWHDASVKFQQEYRDPKRGATKEERDAIKRENDSLFCKVKQTKKAMSDPKRYSRSGRKQNHGTSNKTKGKVIMYNNDPKRVATNEVRLSYAHLNEAYANPMQPGAKPRYSVNLLIPKSDTETKKQIDDAMAAAYEYGVQNKWKGARPSMKSPLIYDGDGVRPNGQPFGAECKGCWVITASSGRKPGVCDINNPNTPLLPQDIYSGMYARVTMSFYNPAQGNPVACSLDNVFKTRDGEPLSGGPSTSQDFAGLGVNPAPAAPAGTATPAYGQGYGPMGGQQFAPGAINPLTGQPIQ